jgi:hypothetical protein
LHDEPASGGQATPAAAAVDQPDTPRPAYGATLLSSVASDVGLEGRLAEPVSGRSGERTARTEPLDAGSASDEDLDYAPSHRTPEQEARRVRFLYLVVALIGAFAVIGGYAVYRLARERNLHPDRSRAAASAGRLTPAASVAAPVGSGRPAASALGPTPATSPVIPSGSAPAAQAGRSVLPGLNVEPPASTDPAVQDAWTDAAQSLQADDFDGADKVFAELVKNKDPATRETARLSRALLWIAKGRGAAVQPVVEDLAAHATTSAVRERAKVLLREPE